MFLLAEQRVLASVDKPNACQVVSILFGSFFTFDKKYPQVSKNIFAFFEYALLDRTAKNQSHKLASLKKSYESSEGVLSFD